MRRVIKPPVSSDLSGSTAVWFRGCIYLDKITRDCLMYLNEGIPCVREGTTAHATPENQFGWISEATYTMDSSFNERLSLYPLSMSLPTKDDWAAKYQELRPWKRSVWKGVWMLPYYEDDSDSDLSSLDQALADAELVWA